MERVRNETWSEKGGKKFDVQRSESAACRWVRRLKPQPAAGRDGSGKQVSRHVRMTQDVKEDKIRTIEDIHEEIFEEVKKHI